MHRVFSYLVGHDWAAAGTSVLVGHFRSVIYSRVVLMVACGRRGGSINVAAVG